MADFQETAADLPDTDAQGNPISQANPLTLADILVRIMELTDVAAGGPYDEDNPHESPFNWSNRALFLRDIFLDQSITALGEQLTTLGQQLTALARQSVPPASTTQQGTVELLTQTEARLGVDTQRVPTIALILDFLRNGTGASASTTRKGTVELATQTEALAAVATGLVLTAKTSMDQLRGANAEATETRRGTLEKATKKEAEDGTANDKAMTPLRAEEHFDKKVWIGTQTQFNAITTKVAGTLYFIT